MLIGSTLTLTITEGTITRASSWHRFGDALMHWEAEVSLVMLPGNGPGVSHSAGVDR